VTPPVITVALLKGGVGKTTTAVALAEAAALSVPTVVLDMDPMGSATRWAELAGTTGRPLRARIRPMAVDSLAERLRDATAGAEAVVIDTPPPGALKRVYEAVAVADIVVMPCPPQPADLDRMIRTLEIALRYEKPAAAVLTQVRGGIEDAAAAAVTLRSWGVSVYATQLPLTVAVQRVYGHPLTAGPLLRFGVDLLDEILKEVQT
jgi:chromosome partitioning protein